LEDAPSSPRANVTMTTANHPGDPTPSERHHRLFFALWPDAPTQTALDDATRTFIAACNGNPVPTRNFHFTLAFLGNVPASRVLDLDNAARKVAPPGALTITVDQINYWRESQILCATSTSKAAEATSLAETLKRVLVEHGFTPDLEKKFRPHVTLARKAKTRIPKTPISPLTFTFTNFALVASYPGPQGSVYKVISKYPHP
jgi:2'-5' RNA ligase